MEISDLWSRRNILVGLAAGGAAGGAAGVSMFKSAGDFAAILRPQEVGRHGVHLDSATVGDWQLQVGTLFTAETGHVLKLVDIQSFNDKTAKPSNIRQQPFVARFDVTKGGPLPGDDTYRFRHNEGGTFDMYLSHKNPANPLRVLAVFS